MSAAEELRKAAGILEASVAELEAFAIEAEFVRRVLRMQRAKIEALEAELLATRVELAERMADD